MKAENVILAYKLNEKYIEILNKISQEINKNILIETTNIWQDIIAVPCFIVFVDLQTEKEDTRNEILQCIKDIEEWQSINIVSKDMFENIDLLKNKIITTYNDYNNKKNNQLFL